MDMRNVAVGVVMEVIATTMALQAPEEETTSPTLAQDNTAVVLDCPQTNRGPIFLGEPCEGPTSPNIGVWAGTAIAA